MSHYTDADVWAALGALRQYLDPAVRYLVEDSECREQVEVILDAVAPAIAARALREASEAVLRNEKPCNVQRSCHLADSITLTERADEIERGAL